MLTGISEVHFKKNKGEAVFGQNTAENFPEAVKETRLQIQISVNPNQDK